MSAPPRIGHADLHVHPSGDAVNVTTPGAVYAALRASGLHVAVLADHDRIDVAAALVARSRSEEISIELVVGEEITTREGHVLGIGLSALVPAGLSMAENRRRPCAGSARRGRSSAAATLPGGVAAPARRAGRGDPHSRPDALETMNPVAALGPRLAPTRRAARRALWVCHGRRSDAHVARAVGRGWTCFHGDSAGDLVAAVRRSETWAEGWRSPVRDVVRRARD